MSSKIKRLQTLGIVSAFVVAVGLLAVRPSLAADIQMYPAQICGGGPLSSLKDPIQTVVNVLYGVALAGGVIAIAYGLLLKNAGNLFGGDLGGKSNPNDLIKKGVIYGIGFPVIFSLIITVGSSLTGGDGVSCLDPLNGGGGGGGSG